MPWSVGQCSLQARLATLRECQVEETGGRKDEKEDANKQNKKDREREREREIKERKTKEHWKKTVF